MFESLTSGVLGFIAATLVIITAGSYLSRVADQLADRTGLGEALIGMFLLAGATSLPDFAATLTAAVDGRPDLAMSNVMGSLAANLVFLAVADVVYRKANLEHAAASSTNLLLAALLIVLLAIPLIAMVVPSVVVLGLHPATPVIVVAYLFGLHLLRQSQEAPMWFPRRTPQTVIDRPAGNGSGGLMGPWLLFVGLAAVTGAAGWIVMEAAKTITDQTAVSESVAGGLFTAIATSSPELVTTIAAVRQGALTLAVSNIIGTNCFNMLVVAAADAGYPQGSIYADISTGQLLWGLVTVLMTGVLLLGMLRRETYGIGRIGFESFLMLTVYGIAVIIVVATS